MGTMFCQVISPPLAISCGQWLPIRLNQYRLSGMKLHLILVWFIILLLINGGLTIDSFLTLHNMSPTHTNYSTMFASPGPTLHSRARAPRLLRKKRRRQGKKMERNVMMQNLLKRHEIGMTGKMVKKTFGIPAITVAYGTSHQGELPTSSNWLVHQGALHMA